MPYTIRIIPEDSGRRTSKQIKNKHYICKGCKASLLNGKMPKICSQNGLTVDILPYPSYKLTELENNLIAKNIILQKLHKKTKSRWSGTHNRLVNIPMRDQDILNTVTQLPRTPKEAGISTEKWNTKILTWNN